MYHHKSVFTTSHHVCKDNNPNLGMTLNVLLSEHGVPQHLDIERTQVQVARGGNQCASYSSYNPKFKNSGVNVHYLQLQKSSLTLIQDPSLNTIVTALPTQKPLRCKPQTNRIRNCTHDHGAKNA